jgi:hypothetical protein
MSETWKAVVGFEEIYEVSDHGSVRRIAPWCDGRKTVPGIRTLKPKKSGYVRVTLFRERVKKEFPVHLLVLAAFVGPPPSSVHQGNHKNGKRSDNRLENLEYLTPSQNQLHACRVLHRPSRPGSKHHNAKLTEAQVLEIRKRPRFWGCCVGLAEEFGVSSATINDILHFRGWKHITPSPSSPAQSGAPVLRHPSR